MPKFKTGHLDAAESALFARQAEYIMAGAYDVEFPEFSALRLLPISNEGGPGARVITYRQFTPVGMAKVVNNYAKDFPRVDILGKEFSQTVKSLGDSYGWNDQEIREAQFADLPLDSMRATTAKEAMIQKLNQIAWLGDTEADLKGLIYHPNVTKAAATTGTWASATNDQILADVNNAIQAVKTLTKGAEFVNTVLLPLDKMGLLDTRFYSTTAPMTLLEILKRGNPGVVFEAVSEMGALTTNPRTGATATTNVMVLYRRDPRKVMLSIPQEFEQWPPQREGMENVVYCHARTAGIITPYPLSIAVIDGI